MKNYGNNDVIQKTYGNGESFKIKREGSDFKYQHFGLKVKGKSISKDN